MLWSLWKQRWENSIRHPGFIHHFLSWLPDKRLWSMIGWCQTCSRAILLTKTWQNCICLNWHGAHHERLYIYCTLTIWVRHSSIRNFKKKKITFCFKVHLFWSYAILLDKVTYCCMPGQCCFQTTCFNDGQMAPKFTATPASPWNNFNPQSCSSVLHGSHVC